MKLLGRIVTILVGLILLLVASLCAWLYLYTADLPAAATLDQYVPSTDAAIQNGTGSISHIVPADRLGKYLVSAVVAAEGQPDLRGPIRATAASLLWDTPMRGQMYSEQIARDLAHSGHGLGHQIDELRLAQQIQRRFKQQEILTIYLNRVYLGEDVSGVEDASIRYFGEHVSELSLDQAALIAGLIRAPNHDSPINHPERAVLRRNWVLDQMIRQKSVSPTDAEQAKAAPLVIKQTANSDPAYDWNRCALTIASHESPTKASIRTRPGERYQNTPVIRFEVLESGEISHAIVSRSSGVADIDNYALIWIKNMRYKERPPGCGTIESQATATVDFY